MSDASKNDDQSTSAGLTIHWMMLMMFEKRMMAHGGCFSSLKGLC
jgi:hypothetical protein